MVRFYKFFYKFMKVYEMLCFSLNIYWYTFFKKNFSIFFEIFFYLFIGN